MEPLENADTLLAYRIGVNSKTLGFSIAKRLPICKITFAVAAQNLQSDPRLLLIKRGPLITINRAQVLTRALSS